jgi:hypothetical protein
LLRLDGRSISLTAALAAAAACVASTAGAQHAQAHRGTVMISAAEALERAHDAIAGRAFHDAPGDIVVTREGSRYTVVFSDPKDAAAAAEESVATRVIVDAESGNLIQVEDAGSGEANPGLRGFISARRAFDMGLRQLRDSSLNYDPNWTTTVVLKGGQYAVTFPPPATIRHFSEGPAYAFRVWMDARSGEVVELLRG